MLVVVQKRRRSDPHVQSSSSDLIPAPTIIHRAYKKIGSENDSSVSVSGTHYLQISSLTSVLYYVYSGVHYTYMQGATSGLNEEAWDHVYSSTRHIGIVHALSVSPIFSSCIRGGHC